MTIPAARKKFKRKLAEADRLGKEGRHAEAEAIWRTYLESCPSDPSVNFNVGWCLEQRADCPQDRFKAAEYYEKVLRSDSADITQKANACNQIGLMSLTTGQLEQAATAFGFALKIQPGHGAATINLADTHRSMGQYELAASEYADIISQDPDNPEARMCSGMLALLLGDYVRGWDEYRWRWKVKTFTTKPFITDRPMLTHEDDISGKTVLLSEEQGFGDSFMFIRYADILRKYGARVLFRCQPSLHRVMGGVFGLDGIWTDIVNGGEFDYWLPLMDAPYFHGTTLNRIPPAHCIRPMPDWIHWKTEGNLLRKRVALVWAGSPTHGKDLARSIQPEMFQPLIDAHPECDFYSLQAGPKQPEVERLRGVMDLAPQILCWSTTAQMLACMDLLVSVDTAVAHLAGAMGIPAWILIPHSPDFRWGLESDKTPWYPKARLFRQPSPDDWKTPIQQINDAL